MRSIELLRSEHRGMEAMLGVLEAAAVRLQKGRTVPADMLVEAIAFFEDYAGTCHHAKEEQALFPLLAKYGLGPEVSFVAALRAQHEVDRAYLLEIKEGAERMAKGDVTAGQTLAGVLREYAELVKEHIRIEETYFDGLVTETISPADDTQLVEQFNALVRDHADSSFQERCRRLTSQFQATIERW